MGTVTGRYLGFREDGAFHYQYACTLCGKEFQETAPELSEPSVCHRCLTEYPEGEKVYERASIRRNRGRMGRIVE